MSVHASASHAAALLCALSAFLLCAASAAAQDAPKYPDQADKAALVEYQDALTKFGSAHAQNADDFWQATCEGFYKSTQALLALDLTSAERVEYTTQLAGILGNYALYESESGGFGEKFAELRAATGKATAAYRADASDENRDVCLAYAKQFFSVQLKSALAKPAEQRDAAFVEIVGNAITYALTVPEFGETVNNLVVTIRTYSPELGEEALDAMCDTFEASGNPVLVKPIQKTLGVRRYARMVGDKPYFEALLLDGGDFTKKFDWKDHENKVVLLEVWATWCGPCRKEIPRLKEVYAKYHDAGLDIVGYSIDQDLDALKKFVVDNELPWEIASQKKSIEAGYKGLYEYYSINGVPEMILVGRDGKVVLTDARGCKLADALKELFPNVEPLGWDPATDFSQRVSEPGK